MSTKTIGLLPEPVRSALADTLRRFHQTCEEMIAALADALRERLSNIAPTQGCICYLFPPRPGMVYLVESVSPPVCAKCHRVIEIPKTDADTGAREPRFYGLE